MNAKLMNITRGPSCSTASALCRLSWLLVLICSLALAAEATAAQALVPVGKFGSSGTGDGQFSDPQGVAIDQSTGDVYVADSANHRIEKFNEDGALLAVWGWGVSDGLMHSEVCTSNCQAGVGGSGAGQFSLPTSVAVDNSIGASEGDVYVGDPINKVVEKFDSGGNYLMTIDGSSTPQGAFSWLAGISVDESGDLWALDGNEVDEFDDLGLYVTNSQWNDTYGSTEAITVDSTTNAVYLIRGSGTVERWTLTGTMPTSVDPSATALAVDPAAGTLYVADNSSGNRIVTYDSANKLIETAALKGVSKPAGLAFNTTAAKLYVADSSGNDVVVLGPPKPSVPAIETESVSGIGSNHATVAAEVVPFGYSTTCYFQYVAGASFMASGYTGAASVPCTPTELGSSYGEQGATATVEGLKASTIYHFRVVATNSAGITYGNDQTFETSAPPSIDSETAINVTDIGATLKAQINPNGGDTKYQFQFGLDSSYAGGSVPAIPIDVGSGSIDVAASVDLTELQPNQTYHFRVVVEGTFLGADHTFKTYQLLGTQTSPDGRVYEMVSPPAKDDGEVFDRFGSEIGDYASSDGNRMAYLSLTPFPGSPAGGAFYLASRSPTGWSTQPLIPPQAPSNTLSLPEYVTYSADLSKGVLQDGGGSFGQDEPPLVGGEPRDVTNLFVRDNNAGSYQLVDVTPAGIAPSNASFAGASTDFSHILFNSSAQLAPNAASGESLYEWFNGSVSLVAPGGITGAGCCAGRMHTISDDGRRVFFAISNSLYVREAGGKPVQIDASQGSGPGGGGRFMVASVDGSSVLYTDQSSAGITTDTVANSGQNLYLYDVADNTSTNLTVGNDVEVQGVVAASEDLSYVYFVANGELTAGATSGYPNLYMYHDKEVRFISTLTNSDWSDWSEETTARTTPKGEQLAFDSFNSLTGYDNRDAITGQADDEVFLYDVNTGRLSCASCNPAGTNPLGGSYIRSAESAFYLQRNLSADGRRLFFNSNDTLLPEDTNGKQDVYEYENGQIHLISTGTSSDDSAFFDASSSGGDVFFVTRQQLVAEDTDESIDLYDARVGGGFQAATTRELPCSDEGCKPPPVTPPVAALPATANPVDFNEVPVTEQPSSRTVGSRRISLLEETARGAVIKLKLMVYGRGRIFAYGKGFGSTMCRLRRAGTGILVIRLRPSERRALRRKHEITLVVNLSYTPGSGKTVTDKLVVRVKA